MICLEKLKKSTGVMLSVILLSTGFPTMGMEGNTSSGNQINLNEFSDKVIELYEQDGEYVPDVTFNSSDKSDATVAIQEVKENSDEQSEEVCMVSADYLASALHAEVTFDSSSEITTIEKDGISVSVENGNRTAVSNRSIDYMNAAPYTQDDEVMLPVKDIAQALELEAVENTDGSVKVMDDYQTKRLIVKSALDIKDDTASQIVSGYKNLHILQYDSKEKAKQAYEKFQQMEGIEFVQPDGVVSINEDSQTSTVLEANNTYQSWGIEKTGMDSYMSYLQKNYTNYPTVLVAVLDTGIDYNYTTLMEKVSTAGKNYITTSNKKNGPRNTTSSTKPQDDNGHGTAVSGIIAEGTLSNVVILPVKVMDSTGNGTDSTVYLGMEYAVEQGAEILNLSLGGEGVSELYKSGIKELYQEGISVVVAAGNEGKNMVNTIPANIPEAITVSSVDSFDAFSSFSNFGNYVDIAAPGTNIQVCALGGGYRTTSGTSFSVPHVSAAIALLKTANPYLDTQDCSNLLEGSSKDLGSSGWDIYFGYGRLQMESLEKYIGVEGGISFDPQPGSYEDQVDVMINSAESDAKIYYTLDGTTPSKDNGILYTGPVTITEDCRVKAVAYLDGYPFSSIITGDYTITDNTKLYEVENGVLIKYHGAEEEIVIPESYDGENIQAIGDNAFEEATYIRSVTIPDTVSSIGSHAFSNCNYLDSILVSSAVTTIGEDAFSEKSTVYGSEGSVIQQYAKNQDVTFRTIPAFISLPDEQNHTNNSRDLILSTKAIGFNLSYQWYQSPDGTTTSAVAIDGATKADYQPKLTDTGTTYYYLAVTGGEAGQVSEVTSSAIAVTNYATKGDLDGDAQVTPSDALLILQHLTAKATLHDAQIEMGDVDGAGLSVSDALQILKYSAEMITEFPAE